MKHVFVLLLLLAAFTVSAQEPRKKILVQNTSSLAHSDGARQVIRVLPNPCADTASDQCLLAGMDSANMRYSILYALDAADTTRYTGIIYGSFMPYGPKYMVTRFDSAGNYLRITRYNLAKQADGAYTEYHPGMRLKTMGNYKYGMRHGRWMYFDEKGKAVRRERYMAGVLTSSKDFKRPRRRYITLLGPKKFTPVPYEIIDVGDSAKVQFASDSVTKTHGIFGFSNELQFTQRDFAALRQSPGMLDMPRDYFVICNTELHAGIREKFFLTGVAGFSMSFKSGTYQSQRNVSVITSDIRGGVRANFPALKTRRTILFINGGMLWSIMHAESSAYDAATGALGYFKNDAYTQSAATAGFTFEFTRKPNVPKWMTCLSLRAGYIFPVSGFRYTYMPSVVIPNMSIEGFYAGIALTSWKVRKQ